MDRSDSVFHVSISLDDSFRALCWDSRFPWPVLSYSEKDGRPPCQKRLRLIIHQPRADGVCKPFLCWTIPVAAILSVLKPAYSPQVNFGEVLAGIGLIYQPARPQEEREKEEKEIVCSNNCVCISLMRIMLDNLTALIQHGIFSTFCYKQMIIYTPVIRWKLNFWKVITMF